MKRGALLMPPHPPELAIADGECWDLTVMGVFWVILSNAETQRLCANRPGGIRWSNHLSARARRDEGCPRLTWE